MDTPFKVNGKPFFILGGQVHNSSAYSLERMETAWEAIDILHANTVEFPVYWEQIEPEEGQFFFDELDRILLSAWERKVKVVLLWFGTWKNGSMQYAPQWVKADPRRFWPVTTAAGNPIWVLSSHCPATWEADRRAFCALLEHLRDLDEHRVVLGVQIENEPGILNSVRDYGEAASREFASAVPAELLEKLRVAEDSPIRAAWERAGQVESGSWTEVFGHSAAEYFTAWSIARYIDRLAEAGKAVYDLPMYVNVWLAEYGWQLPGVSYPSGGPVTGVLDLWKWATPHIDLIAPDIYLEPAGAYNAICSAYRRPDNPLFIPESGQGIANALNLFEAIARHQTIGYAMFGIESLLDSERKVRPEARPLVASFHVAAALLPLLRDYHGTGAIHAVIQREFMDEQRFDFGDYFGLVRFADREGRIPTDYAHRDGEPQRGRGLIITPSPREFFLAGAGFRLLLKPKYADERYEFSRSHDHYDAPLTHYLRVEEGHFNEDGQWVIDRMRNGDEITGGLWVAPDIGVVHAVLAG